MGLRAPGPAALPPLIGEEPNFGQLIQQGNLPVPQQTQLQPEATFGQMFQEPAQEPVSPLREPAAETPLTPEQEEALTQFDLAPEQEAALSQFEITPDVSPIKQAIKQPGFFTKLFRRTVTSAGTNPKEIASILKNLVGDKATVKIKDGEVLIKEKGAKDFRPFDPDEFSASELGLDVADFFGDILEGGVAALTEAGIIAGAAASTLGVGVVPATIAGIPIATAVGKTARAGLIELFGGDVDDQRKFGQELALETGMNLAFLGLGKTVVKPAFSKFKLFMEKTAQKTKFGRVETLALARKNIDEMLESFAPKIEAEEAAKSIGGKFAEAEARLGKKIGVFKEDAVRIANETGQKTDVSDTLTSMRDILEDQGVAFERSGRAKNLPKTGIESLSPLGAEGGRSAIERIANDYNTLFDDSFESGGVNINEVFKFVDNLTDLSKFDRTKPGSDKIASAFKKIRNAASGDRNKGMAQLLEGSASRDQIDKAFSEFSGNIEDIRLFKKVFDIEKDGISFEKLFQGRKIDTLKKFKSAVGEDSKEWMELRGSFMNKLFTDSLDPVTGLVDERNILSAFKKAGKGTVDEFFSKREIGDINNLLKATALVGRQDIFRDETGKKITRSLFNLVAPALGIQTLPGTKAKAITNISGFMYDFSKGDARLTDFLVSEKGLLDLAEKATSRKERIALLEIQGTLEQLIGASSKVKIGKRFKYALPRREVSRILSEAAQPESTQPPPEPFVGPPQEGLSPELEQSIQGL